ncbi:Sec-independent protein translocase subunit TatA [Candidatus Finniella inopinata]|uniref:Sec-independent protein translocase protein TatA n=1 Tax=Candidatus Finniella inopinata TaxID=1696036 RepID=A0A4Q7DG86_9PROT|nr:Sec-independent protein translocase subunit TatA [Candidatus Finniella inopinata]
MGMSFGHLLMLGVIVLVIFGAGKLPQVMGDLAKGLRAFKDGMKDGDDKK